MMRMWETPWFSPHNLQVYEEVQQWDPPVPGLRGIVPIGSMAIPAQVCTLAG